jgi:glycosyltransferase involved in cell wall biosynthesis
MISYNQEHYIEQSLMSALNQETSFHYEIVIGDDCSNDKTGDIIRHIQSEFPDIITILPRPKNLGPFYNALDTQKQCKGEYVAFLEGDDYWTNKNKLQKQVEYLDEHPEYVLCFSNAFEFYEDGTNREPVIEGPPKIKKYYTLIDVLEGNFIPTATVVYRNGIIKSYPDWFTELEQCDWSLYVMLAKSGDIGYLPEILAARRAHQGGLWFGANHNNHLKSRIKSLRTFDKHLNYQYTEKIQRIVEGYTFKLALALESQGEMAESMSILLSNLSCVLSRYVSKVDVFKLLLKYCLPTRIKTIFGKRRRFLRDVK